MFFVRKDNIGTRLGTQKEFAAAQRRDIEFQSDNSSTQGNWVWHYLWPAEKVEPSLRPSDAPYVIWSQEVTVGSTVGDPVITPFQRGPNAPYSYNEREGWLEKAREAWIAAHPAPVGNGG